MAKLTCETMAEKLRRHYSVQIVSNPEGWDVYIKYVGTFTAHSLKTALTRAYAAVAKELEPTREGVPA